MQTMSNEAAPFPVAQAIQAGMERHNAGKLQEAEHIYRRILRFDPANADALHLLGVVASQLGRPAEAVELIAKAVAIQPSNAVFLNNFGNALKDAGRRAEAEQSYRNALALAPGYAEAHANLGIVLQDLGRLREAEQSYRRALELKPDYPGAYNNLGNVLQALGRPDEAEPCYRKALALSPDYREAHSNLGQALRAQGCLAEAEQCFRKVLALDSGNAEGHNNLANVLRSLGRLEEAERSYRQALALDPGNAETHSNLVFLLNYVPGNKPAEIFQEHREFAQRFCPPAAPSPHGNVPDPERRLRIGYVSADLRDHALAFFIEPVLASHNRDQFEIFCYYNYARADAVTERLRPLADHWRDVSARSDEALAELIRKDGIDILVDLSGHTGHSRLLVFGRKPAPVQATWLGYLNTTGLDAMDYRITDAQASPKGPLDALNSEKLVRLPDSQWCYRAPENAPEVSPPPSAASGQITFATFCNPAKIGNPLLKLWGRILGRVPGSRLLVIGATLTSIPAEYAAWFSKSGIAAERLQVLGAKPFAEYLAAHSLADIILDTYPYSGGTTTCHALWMGVPVVTYAGKTATSRGGASLLNAVGLAELIASTTQEYQDIAATLAADAKRLAKLRSGMRKRMAASPLMNEERFTRNLEKAYRAMWRVWCKNHPA
jgi:predicted O-linked N-acetylglucosamine transferase (SPINDLY family)